MALENYTRAQKIAISVFIVVLAGMFTVTGAILAAVPGPGNKGQVSTKAGSLDGRDISVVEFDRIRRTLSIVRTLDYYASRSQGEEEVRAIYPQVPTMGVLPQFSSDRASETSLLDLWPRYQDQDVWCHLVLVERAGKAGLTEPGNTYAGAAVTASMNAMRGELEKFEQSKLEKEFEETWGAKLGDMLPTIRQCLMARDYVDSLVAGERAKLTDIAAMAAGDHQLVKAEYFRLPVEPFMAEARRQVERESFVDRAGRAAAGFGLGNPGSGYDAVEEAYDLNRRDQLQAEATFQFDVISAEFADYEGQAELDEVRARLLYDALKEDLFKASDADRANIEARLDAWQRWEDARRRRLGLAIPAEAEWKTLREGAREELVKYRSFEEALVDLQKAMSREQSVYLAQFGVAGLKAELEEIREQRRRVLSSESDVVQKRLQVFDQQKGYLQTLRTRFDGLYAQCFSRFRDIERRLHDLRTRPDADQASAFSGLLNDMAAAFSDLDREHLETLVVTAGQSHADLESQLRQKEADLESFLAEENPEGDDGEPLTAEERDYKKQQYELEIETVKAKIALRDELLPEVEAFAETFRDLLAEYELAVRGLAEEGDLALRRAAAEELAAEIPLDLAGRVRDARETVVPETRIEALDTQVAGIRAEQQALGDTLNERSADTRELDLEGLAAKYKMRFRRGPVRSRTWEELIEDEDFGFLQDVEGARSFLEEASYKAGAVSEILGLPGRGYYVLRIREKQPRYAQGLGDARERVLVLAAIKRARKLCVEEMKRIRKDIEKRGWEAALFDAHARYPQIETGTTDFFSDRSDIEGIYSERDSDFLESMGSPSITYPDKPFTDAIRDFDPAEGASRIVPEKRNTDPLQRPDFEAWSYLLARPVERKLTPSRLTEDNLTTSGYGFSPAEIWRNRVLAGSDTVRGLIDPKALLEGHEVLRVPPPKEEDEKDNSASE